MAPRLANRNDHNDKILGDIILIDFERLDILLNFYLRSFIHRHTLSIKIAIYFIIKESCLFFIATFLALCQCRQPDIGFHLGQIQFVQYDRLYNNLHFLQQNLDYINHWCTHSILITNTQNISNVASRGYFYICDFSILSDVRHSQLATMLQ